MRRPTHRGDRRVARSELRRVTSRAEELSLANFPDFMLLGPQRTGTTWLYYRLRDHPDVRFSRVKETHFFSELAHPENRFHRGTDLGDYLALFSEGWRERVRRHVQCLRTYGERYRGRTIGEGTASYASLDAELIDEIRRFNPNLKVVMLIRDPVARAWSHAKKDLLRGPGRAYTPELDPEFHAFFARPYLRSCGRYVENLDRWTAALGADAVFVDFFASVREDPAGLLTRLMAFLGIASGPRYLRGLEERANPTMELELPASLRAHLEELHDDDRRALVERFGRYD